MSVALHPNDMLQCTSHSESPTVTTTQMGLLKLWVKQQLLIKTRTSRKLMNQIQPNALQPHIAVADRFLLWMTPFGIHDMDFCSKFLPMHIITQEHLIVMWSISPKALGNYSAGLLRFTCFCDDLGITEDLCMLALKWLLLVYCMAVALGGHGWYLELSGCCIATVWAWKGNNSSPLDFVALCPCTKKRTELPTPPTHNSVHSLAFMTTCGAGDIGKGALSTWLLRLQLWHNINNAPWSGGVHLKRALQGTAWMAPPSLKWNKWFPVTLQHLQALRSHLTLTDTFDAAVFAMACFSFWSQCWLAEVCVDSMFDPGVKNGF